MRMALLERARYRALKQGLVPWQWLTSMVMAGWTLLWVSSEESVSCLQAPVVSFSKTSLLFGIQPVWQVPSNAQMVTLSNVSGLPLKIGSVAITGAAAMDFSTTNACASTPCPGDHLQYQRYVQADSNGNANSFAGHNGPMPSGAPSHLD